MGAPASVLQPNLASIVDDAAAAAEREAALARAAEAGEGRWRGGGGGRGVDGRTAPSGVDSEPGFAADRRG